LNAEKDKLTSELTDRLDDLFSESDKPQDSKTDSPPADSTDSGGGTESGGKAPTASQNDSPLMELDAIVLSLDWEITDENLDKLINEIERLKSRYKKDRLPYMFLQLHGSVGKYIASKKVDAHPDSIKLLHSVHAGLERVLLDPDMPETEKKKILSEEVKKFKGLKHEIMLSKSMDAEEEQEAAAPKKTLAAATPPPQPPPVASPPAVDANTDYQAFVEEIKQLIQAEFMELKKEIMSWKNKP
jgi:hypothetical protein